MPSDDFGGSADEYWKRLAARASEIAGVAKRAAMPEQKPPLIDDTDPLAIIYEALRASAEATKENTMEAKALRHAVEDNERVFRQRQTGMEENVRSILTAVQHQTATAEMIAKADEARYLWAVGGFIGGAVAAMIVILYLPLLWHWVFG
jgi:hypothetical protein